MGKRGACILFFLSVLFSGLPWELPALESGNPENPLKSDSALNRLIEISARLSTLNEKLRGELQDSRRNSGELVITLEASKRELGELRRELEISRSVLTELRGAAENSLLELSALQMELRKAESSLMSLELSFMAYRQASQKRITSLERQSRLLKWGCVAAGILAAGFATTSLMGK